jgi:hypothetical protein
MCVLFVVIRFGHPQPFSGGESFLQLPAMRCHGVFTPYTNRVGYEMFNLVWRAAAAEILSGPPRPHRHETMNQKLARLSQRYLAALRKHLRPGAGSSLRPALGLGRRAVALGLDTLELARIHEQALVMLKLSNAKNAFTRLAGIFFTEANTLIEETHRAARRNQVRMSNLKKTLGRRTQELATSKGQLKRGVLKGKVMEQAFAKTGQHHDKCLQESLELQARLRQLTHRVLAAQEQARKNISRELQDEIAQTLLGINVRLLSLKRSDHCNTYGLQNEIASAQRLVVKSAKSVRRFARELTHHRAADHDMFVPEN